MDGLSRKVGVTVAAATALGTLAAVNIWLLVIVVGFALVLVLFGFWLVAICPVDRQAVGVKVYSLLLRHHDGPSGP